MVTVINVDRNGKVIPDMSKVVVHVDQYPGLAEELYRLAELYVEKKRRGQVNAKTATMTKEST